MNKKEKHQHVIYLLCLFTSFSLRAIIPHNLFAPYDVLIVPYRPPQCAAQFQIAGEFAFHTRGFMGDDGLGNPSTSDSAVNALQIYQCSQDAVAALKGLDPLSLQGQIAQQLIFDDNGQLGLFRPWGTINAPVNMICTARFRLPYQLTLSWYLPYRVVELSNVSWTEVCPGELVQNSVSTNFLNEVAQLGNLDIRGWKRHGLGDLVGRVELYRTFPQNRPWLQMVGISLRGGVIFPTALKADPDKLLAQSFGDDSGFGLHGSGMLALNYRHGIVFGVDGEISYFFGNTTMRRIKTDPAQTDLLLMTKVPAFKDPGFTQRFTLYAEKVQRGGGLAGTLAYEYFKRTDDALFPCVEGFDIAVINNAENLQEITAHSLVFMLSYDWAYKASWCAIPSCSAFLKVGCNGKRAVVADTAGFTVSVAF